jgi:nucleotide-binding universal stress UspA family protein
MFTITKILLPIDFSPRSTDAADAAAAVADHFASEITVLHVMAPPFDLSLATAEGARADSEQRLKEFRSDEWQNFRVKRVLLEGDPTSKIVEYARSEHVDLIMMPTHGYGPFRRLILGSVTAKVLHDSSCLVWTAVHTPDTASCVYSAQPRHIACAVDLGAQSRSILSWATRLSEEFGAKLSVIHVVASLDPRLQTYYLSPEWRGEVINDAKAELIQAMEAAGVKGEIHIEIGSIANAVAAAAKSVQADLLLIGRSSLDGVTGRLPTNAYAIIRESPCPVLSV